MVRIWGRILGCKGTVAGFPSTAHTLDLLIYHIGQGAIFLSMAHIFGHRLPY